jgi:hypothetical protein
VKRDECKPASGLFPDKSLIINQVSVILSKSEDTIHPLYLNLDIEDKDYC